MGLAGRIRMSVRRQAECLLAGAACLLGMMWWFPPGSHGFWPGCSFHLWTGLLCPGCGGTRAMSALVHGQVREALEWNALVVMLVPAAIVALGVCWVRGSWMRVDPRGLMLAAGVVLVFTLLRNMS